MEFLILVGIVVLFSPLILSIVAFIKISSLKGEMENLDSAIGRLASKLQRQNDALEDALEELEEIRKSEGARDAPDTEPQPELFTKSATDKNVDSSSAFPDSAPERVCAFASKNDGAQTLKEEVFSKFETSEVQEDEKNAAASQREGASERVYEHARAEDSERKNFLDEKKVASKTFIWLGALAFGFAGFFLIKYSIENAIFSPQLRLCAAFVFGLILSGGAEFALRKGKVSFLPPALAGAGFAVLFASAFASSMIFECVTGKMSFFAAAFIAFAGIIASMRYGAALAVLASFGAFIAPIASGSSDTSVPLFAYLFVVTLFSLKVFAKREGVFKIAILLIGNVFWSIFWLAAKNDIGELTYFYAYLSATSLLFYFFIPNESADGDGGKFFKLGIFKAAFLIFTFWVALFAPREGWYAYFFMLSSVALFIAGKRNPLASGFNFAAPFAILAFFLKNPALANSFFFYCFAVLACGFFFAWLMASKSFSIKPASILFLLCVAFCVIALGGDVRMLQYGGLASFQFPFPFKGSAFVFISSLLMFAAYVKNNGGEKDDAESDFSADALSLLPYAALFFYGVFALGVKFGDFNALLAFLPLAGCICLAGRSGRLMLENFCAGFAFILLVITCVQAMPLFLDALLMENVHAGVEEFEKLEGAIRSASVRVAITLSGLFGLYFSPVLAVRGFEVQKRFTAPFCGAALLIAATCLIYCELAPLYSLHAYLANAATLGVFGIVALGLACFGVRKDLQELRILALGALAVYMLAMVALNFLPSPAFENIYVGGVQVFNALVISTLLPSVLFIFYSKMALADLDRLIASIVSLLFLFAFVSLEVRFAFHPNIMTGSATPLEFYSYSAAWLGFGISILAAGFALKNSFLRAASIVFVMLAVLKVFFVDASALDGLYRVTSFGLLGCCLIGIGYFYARYVFKADSSSENPTAGASDGGEKNS